VSCNNFKEPTLLNPSPSGMDRRLLALRPLIDATKRTTKSGASSVSTQVVWLKETERTQQLPIPEDRELESGNNFKEPTPLNPSPSGMDRRLLALRPLIDTTKRTTKSGASSVSTQVVWLKETERTQQQSIPEDREFEFSIVSPKIEIGNTESFRLN